MLRVEVNPPAQAIQVELLNMQADAQPNGAVLPEAKALALTTPRSYAQVGLAGRFDQMLVILWTYWIVDIPEVVRIRVPISEQIRHDEILVTPPLR